MSQKIALCLFACFLIFSVNLCATEYSLMLNGSSQYVDCGSNSYFNLTNNLTVEAWIFPTDFKSSSYRNTIASKIYWTSSNTYGWSFRYGSSNGTLEFNISTGGNNWRNCTANYALTLNSWQHVAATYNGSVMKLFVNGIEVQSTNVTATIPTTTTKLCIGAIDLASDMRYMTGNIDEVRIWNVTRTGIEIANNMYNSVSNANLLAYFQMNAGSGSVLANSANSSYNGTLIGSPTWSTNIPFFPCAVTTQPATSVGSYSATAHGAITNLGSPYPTQHGHCWSTSNNPTLADSFSQLGSIASAIDFSSNLTELVPNTTYYFRSYATTAISTEYGTVQSFTSYHTPAVNAEIISPINESTDVSRSSSLTWNEPIGSVVDGYRLYLGTDNPPTNILNGDDIGNEITYSPASIWDYGTIYYWRICPYNNSGTTMGTINHFQTIDHIHVACDPIESLGGNIINSNVTISGLMGAVDANIVVSWATPESGFPNTWLKYSIQPQGFSLNGHLVTFNHDLGFVPNTIAYRILPSIDWTSLSSISPAVSIWNEHTIAFVVPGSKANGDLEVLLPAVDDLTLPVELASFNGCLGIDNGISLSWVTYSEVNASGYYVYRNDQNQLSSAQSISPLIAASNTSQTINYKYNDYETLSNVQYYYWLQCVDYNGSSIYWGPVVVMSYQWEEEDEVPETPLRTGLEKIYPNPFVSSSYVKYNVASPSFVQINVYNAKGQLVKSLCEGHKNPDSYSLQWDGKDTQGKQCPGGVYILKMQAGEAITTQKVTIFK